RRARIAVAWLADGARVQQPAAVQRHRRAARRRPARDTAVVRRDRQSDVTVSDEDERRVREFEGRPGGLLRQDVLPDGVARARVEEVDALDLAERLQAREERTRLRRQDVGGPDGCGGGLVVEVADRELAEDDQGVVSPQTVVSALS